MLESRTLLAIGIGDFPILLPFAQQEGLARRLRRNLGDAVNVLALHGQHQIGRPKDGIIDLACAVIQPIHALLRQQRLGSCVDAMSDERPQTCGRHLDASTLHCLPKHYFSRGTAADIADANKKYVIEH